VELKNITSKNLFHKTNLNKVLYALPRISSLSLITPLLIVQGVYAKYYGISLVTIATVILFVRLFDAIIDPVVGYLSDSFKAAHGTRKPFMMAGAVVLVVSGYFLYSPPENVTVFYFAFWFALIYVGFTLFEIPHLAWGGEISPGTHEKTKIFNLRTAAGYSGLALFYGLPLLPLWKTSEITPEVLHFSAIVSSLLMLPLLFLCMKFVPNQPSAVSDIPLAESAMKDSVSPENNSKLDAGSLQATLHSILYNKPLLIFYAAFLFTGLALGMWLGLLFIFIDVYLGKGDIFAETYLISCLIGVGSAGMWVYVSSSMGKKYTWLVVSLLGTGCFLLTGWMEPTNATYWSLMALLAMKSLFFVGIESMPQSILSDIIDYTRLKFKIYRDSTYFSLYLFIYKGSTALGAALGLGVAGLYGFNPTTTIQTASGVFGLILMMAWIPGILILFAMVFIYLLPINARRHRIIQSRLGHQNV